MARRTIHMSESVEQTVLEAAEEGESFSGTVSRLVEAGARALRSKKRPRWIGSFEGPEDLGERFEDYLRDSNFGR